MRTFWLWMLGTMVVWPVHSNIATVSSKPVDLMLSDALLIALPLAYAFIRSKPTKAQISAVKGPIRFYSFTPTMALLCIVYVTALAGIGLGLSGEMVRVLSAFKLAKPMGFVFLGLLLGSWTDPLEFMDIFSRIFGAVVALTLYFTVTESHFPLGEWGKYLFEWELSGYPNMPMSFYGVMVPMLLAAVDNTRNKTVKMLGWFLAGAASLIVIGSLSRSSTLALFFGTTTYLALTGRRAILAGTFFATVVISIIGMSLFAVLQDSYVVEVLSERVQSRIDRSMEADDPSSGRYEIWGVALELCAEKPVFGYLFESFSRYMGDSDTPHQQYLEVLYKCGSVGFGLYVALISSCLMNARRLLKMTVRGSPNWYRLHAASAMLIGALIGNLTQPNLTYSLTGNMVFLLFGTFSSSRAVIAASQPFIKPQLRIVRTLQAPLRRAA
jgi:O-antigen ligase